MAFAALFNNAIQRHSPILDVSFLCPATKCMKQIEVLVNRPHTDHTAPHDAVAKVIADESMLNFPEILLSPFPYLAFLEMFKSLDGEDKERLVLAEETLNSVAVLVPKPRDVPYEVQNFVSNEMRGIKRHLDGDSSTTERSRSGPMEGPSSYRFRMVEGSLACYKDDKVVVKRVDHLHPKCDVEFSGGELDASVISVPDVDLTAVKPHKGDYVFVLEGEVRGRFGKLIGIDGTDGLVKTIRAQVQDGLLTLLGGDNGEIGIVALKSLTLSAVSP